jgi:hypothetical protein
MKIMGFQKNSCYFLLDFILRMKPAAKLTTGFFEISQVSPDLLFG